MATLGPFNKLVMNILRSVWTDDSRVFWNPDMNIVRDLTIMGQLCLGWTILFVAANTLVMAPIARFLFKNDGLMVVTNQETKEKRHSPILTDGGLRHRRRQLETIANGKPEPVPAAVITLRHKFVTSLWKFLSCAFFVGYGLYAVSYESSWFWSPNTYHVVFPRGTIPSLLYWYYQLETSYYVFSLGLLVWEPQMKDRAQMTVHHLVTITLLVTSYVGRMIKFGVPIMLLHDAADPLMEMAKMFLYCKQEALANVSLGLFTVTFMYLRNWVFPRHIIWTIYTNKENGLYPYYKVTLGSLCTLALLHVYWAFLILKIGYNNFVVGKTTGDIREED